MKKSPRAQAILVATITLLCGLSVSALLAHIKQRSNARELHETTVAAAEATAQAIEARIAIYQYGLSGVRGAVVIAGAGETTRNEFHRYSQTRDIDTEFPGARGFGFIRRVAAAEEISFLHRVRADGMPNFSIRQFAPHSGDRYVIQYLEPVERNQAAIGLDIASEKSRREAALTAMRTGKPILTGPITLVQAPDKKQNSFLLLLPIYASAVTPTNASEREAALVGWSCAPLLMQEILAGLPIDNALVHVALWDITTPEARQQFYQSDDDGLPIVYTHRMEHDIFGRRWLIAFSVHPSFVIKLNQIPARDVFIANGLFALVLAILSGIFTIYRRQRQLTQAEQKAAELAILKLNANLEQQVAQRTHEVARANRLLSGVLNSASEISIIATDHDGIIQVFNTGSERMLGYRALDMIGKCTPALIHDAQEIIARGAELSAEYNVPIEGFRVFVHKPELHSSETREWTYVRKNGSRLPVSLTVTVMRDAAANVVGYLGIASDLTALQQQRRELTEARDQMLLAAEVAELGVWALDLETQSLQWNDRMYEIHDLPLSLRGSVSFEQWGNRLHPEDAESANRRMAQAIKRGELYTDSYRIVIDSGAVRYIQARGQVTHSAAGVPIRVTGINRDITEQIELQARLTHALETTRAILDTAQNPIFTIDAAGIIHSINPAGERDFGYAAAEVIGQNVRLLIPEPYQNETDTETGREQLKAGRGREVIARRKNGSTLPMQLSLGAMKVDGERMFVGMLTDLTVQETQRTELEATRDQMVLAAKVAGLGVFRRETGDEHSVWNERMYEIYDLPQEVRHGVMTFEYWQQCLHPEDAKRVIANLYTAMQDHKDYDETFRIITPAGAVRHLQTRAYLVSDAPGHAITVTGICRDITEQIELQASLTRALETTRAILDTAQTPIITIDEAGIVRTINPAGERDFGYTATEIIGQNIKLLMPEPYQSEHDGYLSRYLREGKPRVIGQGREVVAKRKNGSLFPVHLSVGSVTVGGERIFVGMLTDLTELQQQSSELMAARDQMALAADVAELGVWTWQIADNSLQWNAHMYDIYAQPIELREGGLSYEHWRSRVHVDDIAAMEAHLLAAVEGHCVFDPIFRVTRPDGTTVYVQARAQIERDLNGTAVRVTGINRDITSQLELESSLREAKERADAASAAKSSFLANMSHEIRTPMNAVLGMLQLVRKTDLDIRQRDYIDKANSAAKSLLGLLNDILDYSKIEADKLELDVHPFELETLLHDLAIVLSGNQGHKDVEVIFNVAPTLPAALIGDSLRLQQILINLAGNALKFTERGHVEVSITERGRRSDNRIHLRIAVTDTGIGISPAQQARIFEGFTQAEASTTRRFGGTGLGLVISQRLVALMGSTLQLESKPGHGSSFWFDLALHLTPQSMPLKSTYPLSKNSIRALVVDDNPLAGEVLIRTMEDLGWQAEYAIEGREAVQKVTAAAQRGKPYDVVLMDWRLPDQDGIYTARQISDNAAGTGRPPMVIMITAYGREVLADAQNDPNPPFVDFLTKPVTPMQLATTVQRALSGSASMSATAAPPAEHALRLPGLRVLVVEDNAVNRQIAAELLASEGALVYLATGGLEGVATVLSAKQPLDVVIMDVQMPDIDGLEATRRIRADARFSQLPILAMTANASPADREQCLAAGMTEHIGKPVDLDELVLTLQALQQLRLTSDKPPLANRTDNGNNSDTEELTSILRRFGGKIELFCNMLTQFGPESSHLLNKLAQQIAEHNRAGSAATLHSIKGTASTMGALALAHKAAALEHSLSASAASALDEHTVPALRRLLAACIDQLNTMALEHHALTKPQTLTPADAATPAATQPALTAAEWQAHLTEILSLLESGDLRALELIETLTAPATHADRAQFDLLMTQIQALDFETAALTVRTFFKSAS